MALVSHLPVSEDPRKPKQDWPQSHSLLPLPPPLSSLLRPSLLLPIWTLAHSVSPCIPSVSDSGHVSVTGTVQVLVDTPLLPAIPPCHLFKPEPGALPGYLLLPQPHNHPPHTQIQSTNLDTSKYSLTPPSLIYTAAVPDWPPQAVLCLRFFWMSVLDSVISVPLSFHLFSLLSSQSHHFITKIIIWPFCLHP